MKKINWLAVVLLSLSGCVKNPSTGIEPDTSIVTVKFGVHTSMLGSHVVMPDGTKCTVARVTTGTVSIDCYY